MIIVDSLEQAPDALPALEGAAQDASKEDCASLEDRALSKGSPNVDQVVSEAPTAEITIGPSLQARWSSLVTPGTRRAKLPDRLMLARLLSRGSGAVLRWTHRVRVQMKPDQLLVVRTPLTKGTLLQHICANSTPISSKYRWRLVLRSIPFPSPTTWIKNPTSVWLRTGCLSTTMNLTRRLSCITRLLAFERGFYVVILS